MRLCVRADGGARVSDADLAALGALQSGFSKSVVRYPDLSPLLIDPVHCTGNWDSVAV